MKRLASALGLLLMIVAPVSATVINVPADYALINDAVQAASPGDVVLVAAGTYTDCTHETEGPGTTPACVIMKSGVTLRGAGVEVTIIDAQGAGRGIFIEGRTNCKVENLQIRGAFAAAYGAGILMRQVGSTVEITDVKVTACTDGGVVCIDHASPTLTRLECSGNAAKQGGGLAIEEFSSPLVLDCTISGNQAPSGAGVFIRASSNPVLSGCAITGNSIDSPYGQGAGIFVGESSPRISNCEITDNTSRGNGGGVSFQLGSGGRLENCIITGNSVIDAYTYGAGVAVDSSSPVIEGCVIVNNTCVGVSSDGAGVHTLFSPAPTLRYCTIAYNTTSTAGVCGGLMSQWSSNPTVERCIITNAVSGAGIVCDGGAPIISCSNVFGNPGGNVVCGSSANNISSDPLFCGGASDLSLQAGSPSLNVCGGPIGARPYSCGTTAVNTPRPPVELLGNHPNPFNPSTTIVFRLDLPGRADVRIRDLSGRTVATLTLGDLPAGRHEAVWNGRDESGHAVGSGVYLYELESLGTRHTRRMILIK